MRPTVGRTWTHTETAGWPDLGAHAVEFSKTVAPLRRGHPGLVADAGTLLGPGHRTRKYSGSPAGRRLCPERGATFSVRLSRPRAARPPGRRDAVQAATWTATVRSRGRVSKSSRTTCCQVPRASLPSTTGMATDGPTIAARAWAWPLVSALRRLCS